MKFLLKQLRLFFPFVFSLCLDDGRGGASYVIAEIRQKEREEFIALQEQVKELETRIKELEKKLADSEERRKDPEKYFWTRW